MFLHGSSIVATASILLVLTTTTVVVEGTCKCAEKCPNYKGCRAQKTVQTPFFYDLSDKECYPLTWLENDRWGIPRIAGCLSNPACTCANYCVCNVFGCRCDGCENVAGTCGWTEQEQRLLKDEEEDNEDVCADFQTFAALSAAEKRAFLAEKHCGQEGQVAVDDIYEVLLAAVLQKLQGKILDDAVVVPPDGNGNNGSGLTCAVFNEAYVDVSQLTLCQDKHHLNKKGKKQKKNSLLRREQTQNPHI